MACAKGAERASNRTEHKVEDGPLLKRSSEVIMSLSLK